MIKKFAVSIVFVFVAGLGFSQTNFENMPKHTITVDLGPTIIGALYGALLNDISAVDGSFGFGIGVQYEHQIHPQISAAVRFAYLGIRTDFDISNDEIISPKMSSFSIETHGRFFPFARAFFVSGMLGYGNFTLSGLAGDNVNTDRAWMNYLKMGARAGWRINFGENGGLTFEPSLGYFWAFEYSGTLGRILSNSPEDAALFDMGAKEAAENFFIGGPRVTLALGWRF